MEDYSIHAVDHKRVDTDVRTIYFFGKRGEVRYETLHELARGMINASKGRPITTFCPSQDIHGRIDIVEDGAYVNVWRNLTDVELIDLSALIVSEAEGHRLREVSKVASSRSLVSRTPPSPSI